ncbi:DMT family transporter, partial [Rhodanobacter denitrificans]|nr:DMT family transporter [Rhodanobacter denitrificans]
LRTWIGLAVALIGTVLVVLASGQRVEVDPKALLVLVCVAVSAIFFVGQKALFARNSMLGVTAFAFFAGTLAALPFGWRLPQALAAASWAHIGALLWLGIAPTFIGYLAWNMAVNRASASRVSSFIYLSPPIALLIGWLWLHEVPNTLILVGGAITVGGVVLANARRRAVPAAIVPVKPVEACERC